MIEEKNFILSNVLLETCIYSYLCVWKFQQMSRRPCMFRVKLARSKAIKRVAVAYVGSMFLLCETFRCRLCIHVKKAWTLVQSIAMFSSVIFRLQTLFTDTQWRTRMYFKGLPDDCQPCQSPYMWLFHLYARAAVCFLSIILSRVYD